MNATLNRIAGVLADRWPWTRSRRFARSLQVTPQRDVLTLGKGHAARVLPRALLSDRSVCYSGGVGDDISFDLELIDTYGCPVYAFDPTPAAQEAAALGTKDERFRFLPYGLWSEDAELRFSAPKADSGNWSATEDRGVETVTAACRSLTSLMSELGHDRIDLLKLDIEGAEYEVLDHVLSRNIPVGAICVEFHKTPSIEPMIETSRRLCEAGYEPIHVDGFDVTFVSGDPGRL